MDASLIAHAARMIQDAVCSPAAVETQAGPAAVIILADPMPLWLFPALFWPVCCHRRQDFFCIVVRR